MKINQPTLLVAVFTALIFTTFAQAQSNVIVDGTSGTNSSSTSYSTDGGLNLSLGFFADYLVVGGGGSGGTAGSVSGTGGGGAGGLLQGNTQLSSSNYSVTVGAGGVAPNTAGSSSVQGVNGTNSVFGDLTAVGGGGGGRFNVVGNSGGSGGGGGGRNDTAGGSGTTSNSIVQGNAGGEARGGNDTGRSGGGGGGGAGSAGGNGAQTSSTAGNGGAGLTNSITGSAVIYAGGGGGGAFDSNSGAGETAGTGGTGGGGAGSTSGNASNGTNGLGGGGGGAGDSGRGGNGGSGVVIVRYQGASLGSIGGTVSTGTGTAAGYTIHTFTNTGGTNFNMSGVDLNNRLGATLNGAITGGGNLTLSGPGTITLGASNSYAGTTTISSNTVRLANAGTFGVGAVTNNSAVVLARTDNFVVANNISGSGSLAQAGAGTATLSGNNTYEGNTTVSAGTLQIGNGGTTGSLGSGAVSVATNSTLAFNRSDNIEFDKALAGNGRLAQVGVGTMTLTGANAYTGGTVISSGALKVGNGGTTGELGGGSVSISNGASLVYDRSDAVTLSNALTGAGTLRQSGAGSLTVTGNNSYAGGTVIESSRVLQIGAGSTTGSLGSGAVTNNGTLIYNRSGFTTLANNISGAGSLDITTTASFTTLSGSNTYSGSTRVRGTEITIGQNALSGSTLTTFTNDRTTALEVKGAVSGADVNVGGLAGNRRVYVGSTVEDLNLGGNNENTVLSGNSDFNNTGNVFKVGTGTSTFAGNMNFLKAAVVRSGTLEIAGGDSLFGRGILVGLLPGDNGTFLVSGGTNRMIANLFVGTGGNTGTFNVTGGKTTHDGLSIGNAGNVGTMGIMNVSGGSVETFNGITLGNGAINISGGVVTNSGGIAINQGVSTINLTGNGVLAAKNVNMYGSNSQINIGLGGSAGELKLAEGIIAWSVNAGSALNFNHTNSAYTLGGTINGSKLALNQNGSGKTILTGILAWGGGTTISNGTLQLGNGGVYSPGASDRNPLAKSLVNNGTLAINYGGTGAFSLEGAISGTGSLVKDGTSLLYLSASNTYSGETVINGGTLVVFGANRIGTNNSVTVNSNGTFALGGIQTLASPQTLAALSGQGAVTLGTNRLTVGAANSEFAGRISGAGGVTKAGEGIFTLSGSNSYKGDTIVNGGTLVLGGSNALGSASVVKVNTGGTLEASQRVVVGFVDLNGGSIVGSNNLVSALTLINSGSVSGLANGPDYAAGILKRTAGVATVDGANTYTGTTKIEAGTVQLVEGGSFAAGSSLFLQSGGAMDLNGFSQTFSEIDGAAGTVSLGSGDLTVGGSGNSDFGGVISGSGKLIKSGLGTMTLSAAQSYSGGTEVTDGRLVGNTTSLTGAIANSATIEFVENGNSSLGATVTGNGTLVKSGFGTLTVSDAQAYTGTTAVQGGKLSVNGSLAGGVTVQSGGTLGGSGSVGGQITVSIGGTLSPGNSPGVLTATNGLSLATGSTFEWEIIGNTASGRGTSFDGVDVTGGNLSIGTGVTSALIFNTGGSAVSWADSFWAADQSWLVFSNANLPTLASGSVFDTITLTADINALQLNDVAGRENASFSWNQVGNDVFLNYNVVPEPSTYALLALAAAGFGAHILRRRRK